MIVFACTVICLLFRYVLLDDIDTLTKHLGSTSMCANVVDADAKAACYANQFVYRIGFAMTLFFAAMMLLVGCFKRHVHDGAWCLKVGVLFAIFFASLWINDDSMAGFASATLYGSAVFIVINVLVLLEWVYAWNESWVALAQEDESYFSKLLLSAVLSYVIAIIFIVLCCVQFAASGCDFAIAEVTWTSIGCVLFSVLSISGIADHGSLLCSGIVTLYCCFYCWSALSGMASDIVDDTGARCNTLLGEDGSAATTVNVIFGLLLTCCSLAYAAYATSTADLGTTSEHTAHKDDAEAGGSVPYESMDHHGEVEPHHINTTEAEEELAQPLVAYHFIMLLCTMFMVMTVVNWDVDVTDKKARMEDFGTGSGVVWVKTLSQWLTMALYTWTLVAPAVLVHCCGIERSFDFT